jgi:hypothetical protein
MIRKLSLITGAAAGLLYTLLLFITWKSGVPALAAFLTYYTWTPVVFLIVLGGAWWIKNRIEPLADLKKVLQYALLAYLIYECLYAVSNYGLFGVLDKKLNDQLVQHLWDGDKAKMVEQGSSKERIDAAAELADSARAPLTPKMVVQGFGQNMLLDFIKCLFIATITKQTNQQKA